MTPSSKTKASADKADDGQTATIADRIKTYYHLTKPGIIYGNCLTTGAGYLYASSFLTMGLASWLRLVATLVGTACVIACGCVLNNYIDQGIDSKMERTRQRALVTGTISARNALWFAGILAIAGVCLLLAFTNTVTVYIGLIGLYSYVVAYGIAKRRTPLSTLVGSIPGATPIAAGYTAVSGRFDLTALLLFLAMVAWQMPHFYAIAIFRLKEYKAAGLPVLPAVKGIDHTKRQIVLFTALYVVSIGLLGLRGHASLSFAVIMGALGIYWLWKGLKGLHDKVDDIIWARGMFGFSLSVLLGFSLLLALNSILP